MLDLLLIQNYECRKVEHNEDVVDGHYDGGKVSKGGYGHET